MPPELRDPGDPAEWLRRARSNLAKAKAGDVPEVVYEDLRFEVQRTSEKAIKALLVRQQVVFPKTHAIGELLTLAQESGIEVPPTDSRVRAPHRLRRRHEIPGVGRGCDTRSVRTGGRTRRTGCRLGSRIDYGRLGKTAVMTGRDHGN